MLMKGQAIGRFLESSHSAARESPLAFYLFIFSSISLPGFFFFF